MAVSALLRSVARNLARVPPPPPHHRHVLNRGLHSGTTAPPPTVDKDKIIEDLRNRLFNARVTLGFSSLITSGGAIYGYFWVTPAMKKMRDRSVALEKLVRYGEELEDELMEKLVEHELRDLIRAIDEDEVEPHRVALAQIILTAADNYMKQQHNGTPEKGTTRVDELEEGCSFDTLRELPADLKELRADLMKLGADMKELRAAISNNARVSSEGCSRVGSEN